MAEVKFLLSGDTSVTVEFGNEISPAINAQIRAFNIALEESRIPGITETVPTYRSLMVHYDPGIILYDDLVKELKGLMGQLSNIQIPPSDVLEIPVLYGGEAGLHSRLHLPGRHERGDRCPPPEATTGEDPRWVSGDRGFSDRRVPHRLPRRLAAHR